MDTRIKTNHPEIEVARIGSELWSVYQWSRHRDCGYCVGHYHSAGDANRAARLALRSFPNACLSLAGVSS